MARKGFSKNLVVALEIMKYFNENMQGNWRFILSYYSCIRVHCHANSGKYVFLDFIDTSRLFLFQKSICINIIVVIVLLYI